MKYRTRAVLILIGLFVFVVAGYTEASDEEKAPLKLRPEKTQSQKRAPAASMPIYKPPLRGAPAGRVGGGTRGVGDAMPVLAVLAPEHVGLTVAEQPSFFWHLSKAADFPIEFTLIDDQGIEPLLEKGIDPPTEAGVHQIRLADYDVRLRKGNQYKWFVALVPDPEQRSKDIIAAGAIELVALPDALREKLARADKEQAPYVYAERGIWYEALSSISALIDAAPNDTRLRDMRASLLEQVGLPEVAARERNRK
jgi:hypothetical protein